jgi:hypothetical protein
MEMFIEKMRGEERMEYDKRSEMDLLKMRRT